MQRKISYELVFLLTAFIFISICFGNILSEQQQVESLIEAGKLTQAQTQIENLKAAYPYNQKLPEALYWIARRFGYIEYYEEEKNLYRQIIQNYPNSFFAPKARLGYSRAEVLSLIISGKYDKAEAAIDRLVSDFIDHPDLMDTYYWIAERYRWAHKWSDAQYYYQQIIDNCTDQKQIDRARLGHAKVEVLALIVAKNFGPAETTLNELITNHSTNPDLPETLYRIARGYEWQSKYEQAKKVHELIVNNYADSEFAQRAKIGVERTQASIFITSGQAQDANAVVAEIKADFTDNPDYTDTLYEIARVYDYANSIEQAEQLHKTVVEGSDTRFSSKASIEHAKLGIFQLIDSNDCITFDDAIVSLRENFEGHPDLPNIIQNIANKCAASGYEYKNESNYEKANWCFEQAIAISKITIAEFGPSSELTPQAYYITAVCHQYLGDYEQSILNCQKALDGWPENENSWRVLFIMAQSYEQMAEARLISKKQAAEQINIICEKLLNHSDFQADKAAKSLLKKWTLNK